MPNVVRITAQGKVKPATRQDLASRPDLTDLDTMIPLIQALIPLGLQAFAEVMQAEVAQLAGLRYSRTGGQPGVVRWGQQAGSIFLADQKLPVTVQRVHDRARRQRRSPCRATGSSRRPDTRTPASSARSSRA